MYARRFMLTMKGMQIETHLNQLRALKLLLKVELTNSQPNLAANCPKKLHAFSNLRVVRLLGIVFHINPCGPPINAEVWKCSACELITAG